MNFGNFAKYLLGTSDQTKMVAFDHERPGRWMLVPRGGDGEVVYIDTPPQFIFHYAAAVETAEGGLPSPSDQPATSSDVTSARCSTGQPLFARLILGMSKFDWCCAGDLVVDACVFDAFAPGDFELRDPTTIDKSTLRRCRQTRPACAAHAALFMNAVDLLSSSVLCPADPF